jgi:RNA polymerase sigma-70 factor, ECF subfamily
MPDPQLHAESAAASPETLIALVAAGSRAAFETLYRNTSRQLFGICLRVLVDRAEAEDALQEVYTIVWRRAAQFDSTRASALGWLAMIARSKSIDRLRGQRGRGRMTPLDLADHAEDPAALGEQDAQVAVHRGRLDECMRELDARRRLLIRAAFFEGSTYGELAQRIGAPLGTVKSWIRRGLMQLRTCLER